MKIIVVCQDIKYVDGIDLNNELKSICGFQNFRYDGTNLILHFDDSLVMASAEQEVNTIISAHLNGSLLRVSTRKITEIKKEAARRIEAILPDWQWRRHRDQVEFNVATTLTTADYMAKQQKCQAIRDASNAIESDIQVSSDPNSIDITNHTDWPV